MDMYEKAPEDVEGNLRFWWIPQLGMDATYIRPVASMEQAVLLSDAFADYDLFQLKNHIKPDYCNAGGLAVFEDGEWCEWYDPDTGDDFRAYLENQKAAAAQAVVGPVR